jgi:uncharacterized protein (TIGR02145 family)
MKALKQLILAMVIILGNILISCEKDPETGTIKDVDGNVYKTVRIAGHWWMAENLKVTKFNDDQSIPNVNDNTQWSSLTTAAYSWYNNDEPGYKNTYGALYNWYAVSSGRVCPIGWHVPNNSEWISLTNSLGGETVAGGKLKETGTIHWETPNTGASNTTWFTALPGGYRGISGSFINILQYGYWWSSTEFNENDALRQSIGYNVTDFSKTNDPKNFGFSVRCMRD